MVRSLPPLLRRVTGILVCATALASLGACHRSMSSATPKALPSLTAVRSPGVDTIRTTGGGVLIRVVSGLIGRDPLYVVDGTPVLVDQTRGLDWLAPEQIARVEVLRTPAERAIYGPRGVDGVILITTKGGK